MKLNHLNLVVNNVAETVTFFETYFAFKTIEVKGDNIVVALTGADNFSLVLMSAAMNKKGTLDYPDAFHIGFMLEEVEQVTLLHRKLKDGGVEVGSEPRKIRNSYGFYFQYENIMIEIGHYNQE